MLTLLLGIKRHYLRMPFLFFLRIFQFSRRNNLLIDRIYWSFIWFFSFSGNFFKITLKILFIFIIFLLIT